MRRYEMFRLYSGKIFLMVDDDVIRVKTYSEDKKLKKDTGYIIGEQILIYRGKLSKLVGPEKTGIYLLDDGTHHINFPIAESEKSLFHIRNIVEFDIDRIYNEINDNKDDFLNEKEIEILNANTEVFTTVIKPGDDFLKRVIKEALNRKKINLKVYKDKFKNEHSLNNMKSALNKKSKMSVSYFLDWCEILGLDWTIIVSNSGSDPISDIGEDIQYSSTD
jgi:hypothetical protein